MTGPNLHTITGEELAKLKIDDKNRLYWNGERIKYELTLSGWQKFSAFVVVVAGITTIFNGVSSGLNNVSTFRCSRGLSLPVFGCPLPTLPPSPK